MSKSPLSRVLLDQSDLWPSATLDDTHRVVLSLKALGLPVLRAGSPHSANVGEILHFADAFRAELLRQVHEAIDRAEAADDQHVVRELTLRRAELEQAIAEHERWQAEVEAAAKRLEVIELAAHAFRQSVHEATR